MVMTNIAIENGPVEIVDLPIKNGGSFLSYVSLPEGIPANGYSIVIKNMVRFRQLTVGQEIWGWPIFKAK